MKINPKIVFFGAGAIGGSVGAWVARQYENIFFLDRGQIQEALKARGITVYPGDAPAQRETVVVKVLGGLEEAVDADVLVLAVKNYSLGLVAEEVHKRLGDRPVIISMANGVENQRVLPRYFSKVIYCVISYNAWMDEPGVIGFQKKGPLIFGTLANELQEEMKELAGIFNRGVETIVTDHIQDAVHCKLVINLANSLTTLVGHQVRPISDLGLYQKIMTGLLLEGVEVIRAAGYRECRLGGIPSWRTIWMGARLPRFISGPLFRRNLAKMNLSSMAQDIIQRKGTETELESINGRIVELADKFKVKAPLNRAIYQICKQEFARPGFQPLDVKELWARILKHSA